MTFEVGAICVIHGLTQHPDLNGQHVEILKPLEDISVPERDGVKRQALRYGCEVITGPATEGIGPKSGYFKPENLTLVVGATRRAIDLHLFGSTNDL